MSDKKRPSYNHAEDDQTAYLEVLSLILRTVDSSQIRAITRKFVSKTLAVREINRAKGRFGK